MVVEVKWGFGDIYNRWSVKKEVSVDERRLTCQLSKLT